MVIANSCSVYPLTVRKRTTPSEFTRKATCQPKTQTGYGKPGLNGEALHAKRADVALRASKQ